ncbi:discoidin domain-containing protein [Bacteroidales bacterium OttesenSCG-928-A17]|nr:discoidin domain-containing protein [Bacteroidales bacterium OttesenSCG-928-A17]
MKTFTIKKFCLTVFLLFTLPLLSFADGRQKTNFNSNWKFRSQITTNGPAASSYDDSSWGTINVPHTWNKTDASDGGGNYLKTVGWYRKALPWKTEYEGKKIFLEFLGANTKTECFVNGESLGVHKGGYTAFRYDITDKLTTGDNIIAVKVDNRIDQEIAPLSGDFSFYGGIYRDVSLIVTDPVHVELMDKGAPGLYLTTTNVSKTSATLEVKAIIHNESSSPVDVTLKAEIKHPDTFDAIANVENPLFDISSMAPGGAPIETITETITISANSSYEFKKTTTIDNPRLWNGKKDPYRYLVDFAINQGETVLDNLTEYVGFRYFSVSPAGFSLNGTLYPLRGVNRHQDRSNMGNAITKKEHDEDFGMIYEIGANAVRLAHYPQDPYMYELCDKYGIIVWAEIPFLDKLGSNEATFREVTKNQLVEMIRQQYNRPSILMWGLQNEVSTGSYNPQMSTFMPEMHNLAKAEDPSRFTVQAQAGTERYNWTTDLHAKNQYPGWYQGGTFGSYMDARIYSSVGYYVGMSEYGAGANIHQHEINPAQPQHNGQWHPEEYQNKVHEEAVIDISTRNWIWGTFVWNMFDFGSDSRNEGEQPGINDKGLVTFDRSVKKDSYYVYKVNWNSEPEIYITSRRYEERNHDVTPVTVYSNCESVELFVNGVSQGVKQYSSVSCGIFKWTNIALPNKGQGEAAKNTITVKGIKDGNTYEDEVIWKRVLGQSTEITSTRLVVDLNNLTISLNTTLSVSLLPSVIKGVDGATFKLYKADGTTLVTSGNVEVGMKLKVTSEDGKASVYYEFITGKHLALKKTVTYSAQESSNLASYAVDGNVSTRWAGTSGGNHWIEVDLGKEYFLDQIRIQWFQPSPSRWYTYTVLASNNKSTYATIVNRSSNTQGGVVTDSELLNKGKYRYVKVNVLSATTSGYPSLYELEVYGWLIESTEYEINLTAKTIVVPYRGDNITIDQFLNNIDFLGNYGATPIVNSSAYYLIDGDKLTITDINGNEVEFSISLRDHTNLPEISENDALLTVTNDGSRVFFSLNNNITNAKLDILDLSGRVLKSLIIESQYEISLNKDAYIFNVSKDGYKSQQIKYIVK